ncbi:MAG: KpsF/GutQ family sugar-phosphate isomerase [Deltaproteobacteria bacterium]|nr:KpsF/GutQ family sugar-phosphate isomerase [Deltaproteobacteria bacterium]
MNRPLQRVVAAKKSRLHPDVAAAREVISVEAKSVLGLLDHLDAQFVRALNLIDQCTGRVVVSGMGKSGFIAQKLSATLASTGCPSLYLHPAEALHGDLGRLARGDVLLGLSNSGETEEVVRLLRPLKRLGIPVIAMSGNKSSTLAKAADVVLFIGNVVEASPIGLVPTASTTAMLVLGDALAMTLFSRRGFGRAEFARFHPAGRLGFRLMRVSEVMREGASNPVVQEHLPLVKVLAAMTKTPGRPGAASVIDKRGRLIGVFTDGDLRRLLENDTFDNKKAVREVMTRDPVTVRDNALVEDAERLLREHHIDNMPVVDDEQRAVGLIDVQDLLVHNAYRS